MKKSDNMTKKKSLKYYICIYFSLFSCIILVLLWLFQYFFLGRFYQAGKIRAIKKAANVVIEKYDELDFAEMNNYLKKLAFENALCIIITNENIIPRIISNDIGHYSYFEDDIRKNHSNFLMKLQNDYINQDEDYITYIDSNQNSNSKEIFYCTSFESSKEYNPLYLYIESYGEPINSTVNIIFEQLICITAIFVALNVILTLIISKRLSSPINKLIKKAKKFGSGDFSVEFDVSGYSEIENLSDVLNNAKNELSKINDLRTDLIANISHDLRTPLTMVKAYAEMIRDLSGDNPEKRNEHIGIIIDEADRLSNLVNNILELSKLESGNFELNRSDFSIHDKIYDVLTRYTLLIENDGYDIKFIPDEDRIINADIEKIDQVLYNFINNAINYCGSDKMIRIKQINKTHCVRIEIIDNGKGISKELLPKIFDRYYRDKKYKRDVIGTGLGLSICREILKNHDFAFGVQSEEGKGSVFWFEADIAHQNKKHIIKN